MVVHGGLRAHAARRRSPLLASLTMNRFLKLSQLKGATRHSAPI
jgi:hypothetical protein